MNRREFMNSAAGVGIAAAASGYFTSSTRASVSVEPGEKIVLGCIGLGGRGDSLTKGFLSRKDIEIAYLCDPDPSQHPDLSDLAKEKTGHVPQRVQDYRRVLDDKTVDAVIIAAPDHWHCPLTVHACMAGKDVYVEKPLSYDIWEGRQAVDAARKYKRVVQVGTQSRSAPYIQHAFDYIRSGKLGHIPLCRVCNLKEGGPFVQPPDSAVPDGVNYDLWLGPAPEHAFNRGRFHKQWHNYWDYSGGDMANDAIHQLDIARWFIQKDWPKSVISYGGNLAFEHDDNETPNTQTAIMDFGDSQIVFEQTGYGNYMLKEDQTLRDGDFFPLWLQYATRIELYGTKGLMTMGRHGGGWQVFTRPLKWAPQVVAQEFGRYPDKNHKANFIDCIRSRELPNADVEEGHRTAALVHLSNISCRLGGTKLEFDAKAEKVSNTSAADQYLRSEHTRAPYAISQS